MMILTYKYEKEILFGGESAISPELFLPLLDLRLNEEDEDIFIEQMQREHL